MVETAQFLEIARSISRQRWWVEKAKGALIICPSQLGMANHSAIRQGEQLQWRICILPIAMPHDDWRRAVLHQTLNGPNPGVTSQLGHKIGSSISAPDEPLNFSHKIRLSPFWKAVPELGGAISSDRNEGGIG